MKKRDVSAGKQAVKRVNFVGLKNRKHQGTQFQVASQKQQSNETEKEKGPTHNLTELINDPLRLKLLILSGTELRESQFPQITACRNLLKLDISSNGLESIPAKMDFSRFVNLKLLYLHNNRLSEFGGLVPVFKCLTITYLTIFRNPIIEKEPSLRLKILNEMPALKCLDFQVVLDSERESTMRMNRASFVEKSKIEWPLVVYPNEENQTEMTFLNVLHREIQTVSRLHASCSYVLILQRMFRGWCTRKRFEKLIREARRKARFRIEKYVLKWKLFTEKRLRLKWILESRRKMYLLDNSKSYQFIRAMSLLEKFVREYKKKMDEKKKVQRSARILLRMLKCQRKYFMAFESYFELSQSVGQQGSAAAVAQMRKEEGVAYESAECVFLRRDQLELFKAEDFRKMMVFFASDSSVFKSKVLRFCDSLRDGTATRSTVGVQVFRVPTSDYLDLPANPLIQLIKPSLNCKVIFRGLNRRGSGISEKFNNDESLYYYSPESAQGMKRHPVLTNYARFVEIRDKGLMKRMQLSEAEKAKVDLKVKKIEGFQKKSVGTLVEIRFEHPKMLSYFLRTVIYLNQDVEDFLQESGQEAQQINGNRRALKKMGFKGKEKMLVFFGSELIRVSAAMKIQQVWRRCMVLERMRKANVMGPYRELLERHAATRIQRWARMLAYLHKASFMKTMYHHLSAMSVFGSRTLLMHEEVYVNFKNYVQSLGAGEAQAIVGSVGGRTYAPIRSRKQQLFSLRESFAKIFCDKVAEKVVLRNLESSLLPRVFQPFVASVYEHAIDPISKKKQSQLASLSTVSQQQQSQLQEGEVLVEGDVYHVLHLGTKVARVVVDSMNFVQFTFPSLAEALFRTAIIALKTHRFKKNGSQILLCPLQIVQDLKFIMTYENKIKDVYGAQLKTNGPGPRVNPIVKPIENRNALFICSGTMVDYLQKFKFKKKTSVSMDQIERIKFKQMQYPTPVSKQVHMFQTSTVEKPSTKQQQGQQPSSQIHQQPLRKNIVQLKYFCFDNLYMEPNYVPLAQRINGKSDFGGGNHSVLGVSGEDLNEQCSVYESEFGEELSENGFITLSASYNRQNKPLYLKRNKQDIHALQKSQDVQKAFSSLAEQDLAGWIGGAGAGGDLLKKKTVVFSAANPVGGQLAPTLIGKSNRSSSIGVSLYQNLGSQAQRNSNKSVLNMSTSSPSNLQHKTLLKQQDLQLQLENVAAVAGIAGETSTSSLFRNDSAGKLEATEKFLRFRQSGLSLGRPSARSTLNPNGSIHQNQSQWVTSAANSVVFENSGLVSNDVAAAAAAAGSPKGFVTSSWVNGNSIDYNDPKNVSQIVSERNKSMIEEGHRKIEEERERRAVVREVNEKARETRNFDNVSQAKAMSLSLMLQHEDEMQVAMHLKVEKANRIREASAGQNAIRFFGNHQNQQQQNNQNNDIFMAQNMHFISNQMVSFQRKRQSIDSIEKARMRVQIVREHVQNERGSSHANRDITNAASHGIGVQSLVESTKARPVTTGIGFSEEEKRRLIANNSAMSGRNSHGVGVGSRESTSQSSRAKQKARRHSQQQQVSQMQNQGGKAAEFDLYLQSFSLSNGVGKQENNGLILGERDMIASIRGSSLSGSSSAATERRSRIQQARLPSIEKTKQAIHLYFEDNPIHIDSHRNSISGIPSSMTTAGVSSAASTSRKTKRMVVDHRNRVGSLNNTSREQPQTAR